MYISTFNLRNISTSKCCHQHINVHLSMRSPNQLQLWPTIHLRCTAVPRDVKTAARRHLQGSLIWMNHESDDLDYPLVMTNSLPWYRWPIEIDGLPINSMVIFHGKLLNNQMVAISSSHVSIGFSWGISHILSHSSVLSRVISCSSSSSDKQNTLPTVSYCDCLLQEPSNIQLYMRYPHRNLVI